MYSKDLGLDLYINCLWNYFNSYYDSLKKNIYNQETKWLKILERSKLKLDIKTIDKLIKDPNNIFKITKYKDISLNQVQLLKLRFFIVLYWLNYLLITVNSNEFKKIFNFDEFLLINWSDSIDTLISIFESRNEILILERDKIYENLDELEKIRIKCPNLDSVHQTRLESQLKALRHILNIESSDELRDLSKLIKELNSEKFVDINNIIDGMSDVKKNLKDFLNLFEHISCELLSKNIKVHINIFEIQNSKYDNLIETNLNLRTDLQRYRNTIYNVNSLTWSSLDNIKLLELKVNLKNIDVNNFLISKVDNFCNLIYQIILKFNSNIFSDNFVKNYTNIQKNILKQIDKLKILKVKNYEIISNLEKEFNYSDLKDLDLEFYYQFLTHINTVVNSILNEREININSKKYLSNEHFMDRKKFDTLVKNLNSQFVTKKEFKTKINQIETRITNIEENNSEYVLGTMVISLISLFIWRKMIRFRRRNHRDR